MAGPGKKGKPATQRTPQGATASGESQLPSFDPKVARSFDGLDMTPPGLVPISQWGLAGKIDTTVGSLVGYRSIGRKP